jgi:hypothetical protein
VRHDNSLKMAAAAESRTGTALRTSHVGLTVFAPILCRKFAVAATFSWHLLQRENGESDGKFRIANCRRRDEPHELGSARSDAGQMITANHDRHSGTDAVRVPE